MGARDTFPRYDYPNSNQKDGGVLAFWDKHGIAATLDAHKVKRRTLFNWKKALKKGEGKLEALNRKSTAPKTTRKRIWDTRILEEIKHLREEHPNIGKEKIHPLLAEFCTALNLRCPKIRTIGRLIKDLGGLRLFPSKLSHFGMFRLLFPYPVTFVLTDNGSEFKKHFTARLLELQIAHYHTYPRTPKMNAHVERFNRTIQEEFLNYHKWLLLDCDAFNTELMDWLVWYNTKRVHFAFGNKMTPVQFLLSWKPKEMMMSKLPAECKSGWPHTRN